MRTLLGAFSLGLLLLASHTPANPLFKCEDKDRIAYQSTPCKGDPLPLDLPEVMTPLMDVHPDFKPAKKKQIKKNAATCPFFTSTQLRNMRVKRQFETGVSEANLLKLLGPADRKSGASHNETWIYTGERMDYQFKFKQGCLISWKEKWKTKKKTEIDRYLPNF